VIGINGATAGALGGLVFGNAGPAAVGVEGATGVGIDEIEVPGGESELGGADVIADGAAPPMGVPPAPSKGPGGMPVVG
jgi:hypothetical protein